MKILVVGGIGDICYQLVIIYARFNTESFTILCSESQHKKILSLQNMFDSLFDGQISPLRPSIEQISDSVFTSLISSVTAKNRRTSHLATCPHIEYSEILKCILISFWVGFCQCLSDHDQGFATWPTRYYHSNSIRLESLPLLIPEESRECSSYRILIMFDANSIEITPSFLERSMLDILRLLPLSITTCITYIVNDQRGSSRPDLALECKETTPSRRLVSVFGPALRVHPHFNGKVRYIRNPSFDELMSELVQCEFFLGTRSGLCDIAYLVGKEVLSLYANYNEFVHYKMSETDRPVGSYSVSKSHLPVLAYTPSHSVRIR